MFNIFIFMNEMPIGLAMKSLKMYASQIIKLICNILLLEKKNLTQCFIFKQHFNLIWRVHVKKYCWFNLKK